MTNDYENKNESNDEYKFEGINPLRGILKNPDEYIIDNKILKQRIIIISLIVLSIFIITPIIVYFIVL
jgi:hypothetical protein